MEIGKYRTTGEILGKGAFGSVELASNGKKNIAIKCISKKLIVRENMGIQVSKEVSILKNLKHPNIVQIEEVLMSSDYLYILMEYVTGGELFQKITINGGRLSEDKCAEYIFQLCDALQYCHNLNVCHRDIKPQNILLDENDNIKLADFGFATIMEAEDSYCTEGDEFTRSMEAPSFKMKETHTLCGTDAYMAPEIVSRRTYMGDKVDVWAMGTVSYLLLVGKLPFKSFDTKRNKYDSSYLTNLSADFISKCLQIIPELRWSAKKLLEHEWLQSKNKKRGSLESNISNESNQSIEEDDDEDEESLSLEIKINTKNDRNYITDQIKNKLTENGWRVRDQMNIIKTSKKLESGFEMITVTIEEGKDGFDIHINNGSAIKMASNDSKIEVRDYISDVFN